MKDQRSRLRWLLAPMALAAVGLAACTTPPTPPDPTTPWLEAGCIDSSLAGVPDFQFSGIANELGNGVAFDVGGGVLSEDGTCTGAATESGVIVRAADSAGAIAVCGDLGITVTTPARLVDFGYVAPVDAWTCLDA